MITWKVAQPNTVDNTTVIVIIEILDVETDALSVPKIHPKRFSHTINSFHLASCMSSVA